MYNFYKKVNIVLLVLILMSCAAPVYNFKVKMLKPAELYLGSVEKIAISDFKGLKGDMVSNKFTAKLFETQTYQILERSELNRILDEQGLSQSGIIDESNAMQVGKLAGVDALIFGSVDQLKINDEHTTKTITKSKPDGYYYDDKGKKQTKYTEYSIDAPVTIRKGYLTLTFKAVNIQSGQIVAMRNVTKSWEGKHIKDPAPEHATVRNLFKKGPFSGSIELPSKENIETKLVEAAVSDMIKLIAPHYVYEKRIWQQAKLAKTAFNYFKTGLYSEALEDLNSVYEQNKSLLINKPKDEAMLLYDIGLLNELLGDLEKAESFYKKAIGKNSNPLYMKALANLKKAKEDREKLKAQKKAL